MDAIREKLKEFYMKQHTTMLSVRKTASNCLLVEKRDGKKAILARFNIACLGAGHAWSLAMNALSTLAYQKAAEEMGILEGHVPPPAKDLLPEGMEIPIKGTMAKLTLGTLPTDAEGMEMPIKEVQPVVKANPLGDLFDMGRTASEAKPLE